LWLKLESHEYVVDIRGRLAREKSQLRELLSVKVVGLDKIVKLPQSLGKISRVAGNFIILLKGRNKGWPVFV
jgi:hypothetical protein